MKSAGGACPKSDSGYHHGPASPRARGVSHPWISSTASTRLLRYPSVAAGRADPKMPSRVAGEGGCLSNPHPLSATVLHGSGCCRRRAPRLRSGCCARGQGAVSPSEIPVGGGGPHRPDVLREGSRPERGEVGVFSHALRSRSYEDLPQLSSSLIRRRAVLVYCQEPWTVFE